MAFGGVLFKVVVKGAFDAFDAFVSRVRPAKGPAVFSMFFYIFHAGLTDLASMLTACSAREKNARPPMNFPGGNPEFMLRRVRFFSRKYLKKEPDGQATPVRDPSMACGGKGGTARC